MIAGAFVGGAVVNLAVPIRTAESSAASEESAIANRNVFTTPLLTVARAVNSTLAPP